MSTIARDWRRFPNPPVWRRMPGHPTLRRLWMLWGALVVWEATERYFCFGPHPVLADGLDYWTVRMNVEWRLGARLTAADAIRFWRPV